MFVRVKTTPNSPRKSVQVVRGARDPKTGKVKQTIVRHVGIAFDEEELEKLKNMGYEFIAKVKLAEEENSAQLSLFKRSEKEILDSIINQAEKGRKRKKDIKDILPPSEVSLDDIVEEKRINEGINEVAGSFYDDLFKDVISYKNKRGKEVVNKRYNQILKDIILLRIIEPYSKRKSQKLLLEQFDKDYNLDTIYNMMDKLYHKIDSIKLNCFNKTNLLSKNRANIVFFDVTTLYFESETDDELRKYGYSKDHKFNTVQIVLALASNDDGLPIAYELFEGSKAEVRTLIESINNWKKYLDIKQVCFVADRAMFSQDNIDLIVENNYNYVVAAKLKTMDQITKNEILDEKGYILTNFNDDPAWVKEMKYKDSRLITSYKKSRALRDFNKRQKILDKLNKLAACDQVPTKKLISSTMKKYLQTTNDKKLTIDPHKIKEQQKWDGFHGCITNLKDSPNEILSIYARLYKIEECFRINKHNLKMRPIYHHKPQRIKSHIAICYMSFAILRYLQYQINLTTKITTEDILHELVNCQASIYIHKKTKDRYRVPGVVTHKLSKIYRSLNLKRSTNATIYLN
jgi:transposase